MTALEEWGTWETVDEVGWYWWLASDHSSKVMMMLIVPGTHHLATPPIDSSLIPHKEPLVVVPGGHGNCGLASEYGGHWMKIVKPEYKSRF